LTINLYSYLIGRFKYLHDGDTQGKMTKIEVDLMKRGRQNNRNLQVDKPFKYKRRMLKNGKIS